MIFEEAYQENRWMKAMKDEIHSIIKNNIWELTTRPERQCNRRKMDLQDKEECRRRN